MSNESPAFQFYPNDWLSSPKIMNMTPAQEGAYIRLLAICWANDGIPDDDKTLSVLSRLGNKWFKGGSRVVKQCFIPHPNRPNFLYNERLLKEKIKQANWKLKSREGGLASAKVRWGKKLDEQATTPEDKGGYKMVQPNGNSSSSSSISSSNKENIIKAFREFPETPGNIPEMRSTYTQEENNYTPFGEQKPEIPDDSNLAKLVDIWAARIGKQPTGVRADHIHQIEEGLAHHGLDWCQAAMEDKKHKHVTSPKWTFTEKIKYDAEHPVDTSKERQEYVERYLTEQANLKAAK